MPSLSMETLHHPVPHRLDKIELGSITEVPDSHAWPAVAVHDYPSVDAPSESESVPLIDLSSATRDVVAEIGKACESWGAFQVIGHDASVGLLDSLESEARRLFRLPAHRKLRAAKSPGSVTGYGLPPMSSFFSKIMWSEGFTISGSPVDDARKLWPQDYAGFCEVIEEYNKEMEKLAERLMQLKLLSLGLTEPEGINWDAGPAEGFRDTTAVLQLNSYPVCPEPDRAMGLAAHTDSGLLTILHQSSAVPGLQLLHSDRWVTVPPVPGALVVIIGDLGHVLSNGRFKNVVHRAVVNRDHHRISAAYLCGPSPGVKVSPVVGKAAARAYRAVTWREYLGLRAKFFDKAIELIKVRDTEEIKRMMTTTTTTTTRRRAARTMGTGGLAVAVPNKTSLFACSREDFLGI